MPKVVINTCFGGFGLSDVAHHRLGSIYVKPNEDSFGVGYWNTTPWDEGLERDTLEFRALPALVDVVELLGDEANGSSARLRIVDVPKDARQPYITDYDGRETVRESHRVWR